MSADPEYVQAVLGLLGAYDTPDDAPHTLTLHLSEDRMEKLRGLAAASTGAGAPVTPEQLAVAAVASLVDGWATG